MVWPVRNDRRIQHDHAVFGHPAGEPRSRTTGSTPSTRRTRRSRDTDIRNEVKNYINTRAGGSINTSTVYEVFLPNGFYSTSGGSNSCGGPNLQYCAYHWHFTFNGKDVKYGSMPYPSCGGCQWTGWTDGAELRALHLPRDPRGGDRSGPERLVRQVRRGGRRQVRLVARAVPRHRRLRLPVRVVERRTTAASRPSSRLPVSFRRGPGSLTRGPPFATECAS